MCMLFDTYMSILTQASHSFSICPSFSSTLQPPCPPCPAGTSPGRGREIRQCRSAHRSGLRANAAQPWPPESKVISYFKSSSILRCLRKHFLLSNHQRVAEEQPNSWVLLPLWVLVGTLVDWNLIVVSSASIAAMLKMGMKCSFSALSQKGTLTLFPNNIFWKLRRISLIDFLASVAVIQGLVLLSCFLWYWRKASFKGQ